VVVPEQPMDGVHRATIQYLPVLHLPVAVVVAVVEHLQEQMVVRAVVEPEMEVVLQEQETLRRLVHHKEILAARV
jgi:hypothetical protein